MPFISNGIYSTDDTGDGIFTKYTDMNIMTVDMDTTFVTNVLDRYRKLIDDIYASTLRMMPNPFFVKDGILYCTGYYGDIYNSNDTNLYWHTYDINKKTYTTKIIPGVYRWYNKGFLVVPVYRIEDLKFLCAIYHRDYDSGECYIRSFYIIDYKSNTSTVVLSDITYLSGVSHVCVTPSKMVYLLPRLNMSTLRFFNMNTTNPSITSLSYNGGMTPIYLRTNNGSDEIVYIDEYSQGIKHHHVFGVMKLPSMDKYIESSQFSASNTQTLENGKYHGAAPVELNYNNIHCVWVFGPYGNSPQLIVTGSTDTTNNIQPFRLIGTFSDFMYIDRKTLKLRRFGNTFNYDGSVGDIAMLPIPYIPDLTSHAMYGLPKLMPNESVETIAIMVKITIPFLDELDTKGGSVW